MPRTVAGTRDSHARPADLPEGALTGQQALDALMCLLDIYGNPIDGQKALRLLAIARQHGIKAEGLVKGMVTIRLAGRGYTLTIQ